MRKATAIATFLLAVLTATPAIAGTSDYFGRVSGGGDVQLRLKKKEGDKGGRRVTRFDFQRVGVKCHDKHWTTGGNLSFTAPVSGGDFYIRGTGPKGATIRIKGTLKDSAKKMKGTIRLDGTMHVDGRKKPAKDCHSGVKDWNAKRL